MTDQTPTDAQAAARDALLSIITDAVKDIRDISSHLANRTELIESLAKSYSLVVGGAQGDSGDDAEK